MTVASMLLLQSLQILLLLVVILLGIAIPRVAMISR
jgi:hypothetical protein